MAKKTAQSKIPAALGVATTNKKVFLYLNLPTQDPFTVSSSSDGLYFRGYRKNPAIVDKKGTKEDTKFMSDFRISKVSDKYLLIYKQKLKREDIRVAISKDLIVFEKIGSISGINESAVAVAEFKYKGQYVMYFGENEIKIAYSKNLKRWDIDQVPVLKPREGYFDSFSLEVGSVISITLGILLIYYVKTNKREGVNYSIGAALFDRDDPRKLIWRRNFPIWEQTKGISHKKIHPLGTVKFKDDLLIYLEIERESIFVVSCSDFEEFLGIKKIFPSPVLKKVKNNPILKPVITHPWESKATFNPATIYEGGKVHFVYRAIGDSNTSVLGYAASSDGEHIDERLDNPIYIPREEFECPGKVPLVLFLSGGGYGGCEDPRLTRIDDKLYMTYVAFNGSDHPRVALTSITVDDFLNKRWNFEKPKIISPKGVIDKNACLFPEKINGKYVFLHRIFPNILIDFVDDLNFDKNYLKGEFCISPRENSWDSRKVGAGAPPIKTKDGWLLIYHAVDNRNASQYKIGAMILNKNDPTKVTHWSNNPILEPTHWYENEGYKKGVAYPCGAVVLNNNLVVYYGGADTVVCAAKANLDKFISELKISSPVRSAPKTFCHTALKYYD